MIVSEPYALLLPGVAAAFERVVVAACRAERAKGRRLEDDVAEFERDVVALARVWRDGSGAVPVGTGSGVLCDSLPTMTIAQIRTRSGRSAELVRRECRAGVLMPYARSTTRGWAVEAEAAEQWIAEHGAS